MLSESSKSKILDQLTALERALQRYFNDVDYHSDVRTMSSEARALREDWESWAAILREDHPEEIRIPFWEPKLS